METGNDFISTYSKLIVEALQTLGQAVATALNLRDLPTIKEMQVVTDDIFEQALNALDETRSIN